MDFDGNTIQSTTPYLSLIVFFAPKSALFEINIVSSTFFWLVIAWYVFLHPLTFSIFIVKRISLNIQQGSNKADEILLNVMWQPGLDGSLGENEYMFTYG